MFRYDRLRLLKAIQRFRVTSKFVTLSEMSSTLISGHHNTMEVLTRCPDFKSNEIHIYFSGSSERATGYDEATNRSALDKNPTDQSVTNSKNVSIYYFLDTLCTMSRPHDESITKTLKRLLINFTKKSKKKSSMKKKSASNNSEEDSNATSSAQRIESSLDIAQLSIDGSPLDTNDLTNSDWKDGMILIFQDLSLTILVNPPTIRSMYIYPKSCLMVGYPIIPTVSTEFADESLTEYLWFKQSAHGEDYHWISSDKVYYPTKQDIGHKLKLYCTAKRSPSDSSARQSIVGRSATMYINGIVSMPPQAVPKMLEVRHDYNQLHRNGDSIRIISFNILADPFATSDFALNHLYSYCPPVYLETEYRLQLILEELVAYQADIICLQECDSKSFTGFLNPAMRDRGYSGHYTNKAGGVPEGCAMFVKQHLRVISWFDVPIKEILREAKYLAPLYALRRDLKDILGGKLSMIAQIAVIEFDNSESNNASDVLLVSNTHLFYHPAAAYARLLQSHAILVFLQYLYYNIKVNGIEPLEGISIADIVSRINSDPNGDICSKIETLYLQESSTTRVTPIFAGDLNSTTETAVIEYLERGVISEEHEVWSTVNDFKWGQRMEGHPNLDEDCVISSELQSINVSCALPTLRHPFKLISAAGYPKYTNYTGGFKDVLDYIYIESDDLTVATVGPFPTLEELSTDVALPSSHFPSDHMAVAVDIVRKSF